MQIEIKKFYVNLFSSKMTKGDLLGTFHIYFSELGIDLRGISVIKIKDRIKIILPFKKIPPNEQKKSILREGMMTTYPIFCLTPSEKQNEFYHQFSDMAIEYLHKNHADILNRDVKSLADWPEKKRVEKPPVKEFEKPFKTELKKPAFPKKSAPVQENRPVPGNQLKQLIEDLKKKRAAERNY